MNLEGKTQSSGLRLRGEGALQPVPTGCWGQGLGELEGDPLHLRHRHRFQHLLLPAPSGSFKRRGLLASPATSAKAWDFIRPRQKQQQQSSVGQWKLHQAAANAARRARATMSGRVGDLSPKQKEALDKASPHPWGDRKELGRGQRR